MTLSQPRISVVVPTLDEEGTLPELLAALRRQEGVEVEIIVADGGSTDRTTGIAQAASAIVVSSERGRGRQMNAGARRASNELLAFLHADSQIDDPGLLAEAIGALDRRPDVTTAGHFALRFLTDRRRLSYHHYENKTELNRPDVFGGDQGLLLRKPFFEALGGFDESLHFLEDKQIAQEIHERGRMVTLPGRLGTSTRRFDSEGFARRMLLAAVIMGLREIDWQPFFQRVREIYNQQSDARRLEISRFFGEIHRLSIQESAIEYCRGWYGIGRYVRRNLWQAFFFGDSCLSYLFGTRGRPFLWIHDRIVFPLTDFRLFSGLTAVGVWVGFYLAWFWYRLRDGQLGAEGVPAE